jgi:hypothetical protein
MTITTIIQQDPLDEIVAAIARLPEPPVMRFTGIAGDAVVVAGTSPVRRDAVVVAAIDDDANPGPIITYAVAQARRSGAPLRVVHVWTGPLVSPDDRMSHADCLLAGVLREHLLDPADPVEREILHDAEPAAALLALSQEAALLVVAASSDTLPVTVLGDTVRTLIGRTACPLAIVPAAGSVEAVEVIGWRHRPGPRRPS